MMDLSSVIDAGLVVIGSIAVLLMGLWTLSAEVQHRVHLRATGQCEAGSGRSDLAA